MYHDVGAHGPWVPSRRAFGRAVAAGASFAALAAVAACSPQDAPGPGSRTAVPTDASTATASGSPSATSTQTGQAGTAGSTAPGTTLPGNSPAAAAPGPKYSLTDPASQWVVVNKHRPLSPADYAPADLTQPAVRLAATGEAALLNSTTAAAAERMFADAAAAGVVLTLASGYRSYATQTATYDGYVNSRGRDEADTASARPGYSEHQTGWSFDVGDGDGVCSFQPCFADEPAAVWAKANAYRFGFVVRYPWMLQTVTGYYYEPWHLRYIGIEAAGDMHSRGIATLEEYFGLEPAPAYL
ncbi:D-alanyl-D-alanine carboxypeptidase family protein [Arthrobacter sp. 2YAF22_2]|uniref:M15 family metallopeptidase n=1 Tax=Arthrobacter sp. 2YAF22_2 TaxID=3233029 RepID=UPI003F8FD26D